MVSKIIMNIPNNSLTEEINELVRLYEQVSYDYDDDASWFIQPAISYCYGAGLMDKVRTIFKCIILGAVFLSALSMLFMMFLGQYVAPIFVKPEDTELLAVSITGIKIFSFSYLVGWVDMCFSSYFTALEKPVCSLLTSFLGTLVFPIVFLFILTPIWELNGVWFSTIAASTASAVFTIILALTMKSKQIS